ncbi:MAG: phosphoadenylyl-sulfate reductase [Pseudomonadota bacterium]|nr:phosphoadenylyl-sulfate reductase [Pseudomonadota bacterium]
MKCDSKYLKKLNQNSKDKMPYEIIEESIKKNFKDDIAYVCSFGSESAIILHMISEIKNDLPIIMLNTNFLFSETLEYRDYLLKRLKLTNFKEIFPDSSDIETADKNNDLWKKNPDSCCNIRKVVPLQKELEKYTSWISGRKSYHEGERRNIKSFEYLNGKIVINPLADVEKGFVDAYFKNKKINRHPLVDQGYLSIGCINCTVKTIDVNDPRSGRWHNKLKTECGIHYNIKK